MKTNSSAPKKFSVEHKDVPSDPGTSRSTRDDNDETILINTSDDEEECSDIALSQEDDDSDASYESNSNLVQLGEGYWSYDDRSLMLVAIKKHGMLNVEYLAQVLNKDETQIRAFFTNAEKAVRKQNIRRAKRRAMQKIAKKLESFQKDGQSQEKKGGKRRYLKKNVPKDLKKGKHYKGKLWAKTLHSELGDGPIEWWLDLMKTNMAAMMTHIRTHRRARNHASAVCEMLPRALQVIAKYEDHPDPSLCAGVDFKEAYEYLGHMLSGVPGKMLNLPTSNFILRSINKLRFAMLDALYSPEYTKHFGAQLKHVWSSSKESTKFDRKTYGKMANSSKLSSLLLNMKEMPLPTDSMQMLLNIPSFNLLKVPEPLLITLKETPVEEPNEVPESSILPVEDFVPITDIDNECVGLFSDTDFYVGGSMNLLL